VGEETGGQIWDPLGISSSVSDEAVMWFRHSELKHGRVAMVRAAPPPALRPQPDRVNPAEWANPMRLPFSQLATSGYLIGAAGITFPGDIAKGVSFASVGANGPYAAWDSVPTAGKLQILSIILALEWASETKKPHYVSAPFGLNPDIYIYIYI